MTPAPGIRPTPRPRRRGPSRHRLLRRPPRSGPSRQHVAFGTSGHRGTTSTASFNEDHILATTQASASTAAAKDRRAPVPRSRHPRPVRAGVGHRARGARRQRRLGAHRQRRPLHAHARRSHAILRAIASARGAGWPTASSSRRRTTRRRRRVQVQPAPRRAGRHRRHRAGSPRGPTSCSPRACRRRPGPFARPAPRRRRTTSWPPTSTTCRRSWTSTPSRRRRRIGADPLGGASVDYWGAIADATGSTSPSSTRWSTRRGGS